MIKIYNSLTRREEEFKSLEPEKVKMYVCGPTVYDYPTVGNWRTYTMGDIVNRTLRYFGYDVHYIINLTDVGHLTGDNLGDADVGEDRIEKTISNTGKTAKEITDFYIADFFTGFEKMNFIKPDKFTRATEYIQEQIDLIKKLEEKGFTYRISDGIYFDASKYPDYGKLSGLKVDEIQEGARVEKNPEKKNANDFALWKFSPNDGAKREQEWNSPWGVGFPGWHLECSAMILKELGETIDIHGGGEDLRMIHHQNEIAQSESATGKKFVNYWMHGSFINIDGGKMGKSLGNAYTIQDLEAKGFSAIDLKFFYMNSIYRSKQNFTWEALQSAKNGLDGIKNKIKLLGNEKGNINARFVEEFKEKISDDFNIPQALAVLHEVLKSDISNPDKLATVLDFDRVLGLKLDEVREDKIPQEIIKLAEDRKVAKQEKNFELADNIRSQINEAGYEVEDLPGGDFKILKK
mgnify:CR=1 FL=1